MPADGRNRISVCTGCVIFLLIGLAILFLFVYWFIIPPLRWLSLAVIKDNNDRAAMAESHILQQEAASGFVEDITGDSNSFLPPLPPLPPPPEPPRLPTEQDMEP